MPIRSNKGGSEKLLLRIRVRNLHIQSRLSETPLFNLHYRHKTKINQTKFSYRMQVCWVLVFVSFFYCSLGDSTLYVENSQYISGSNCTINDPCSSIQEAIDVFFAGTTTPYSTKLVIYLSSGEYPASGNSEITMPAWSEIAIPTTNINKFSFRKITSTSINR